MDDSFSDFKEKKKCKIGPKAVQKSKNRQKKPLKPTKGQKDIRALIKKNELVSYSRDFNEVCKESGIDVDAEQLQLAIALSKSLDSNQSSIASTSEDVEVQNKLSSQERTAKIRSTLQEYGFKVNGSKVPPVILNKRRKYSKHSKLLTITNEERQTKISAKYAEVLALNCHTVIDVYDDNYLNHEIFYKATNISYEHIKNDDVYYVSNLIEKATHKSCLLRNWSEIPGRPASPEPSNNDIDFHSIQCSEQDLDEILSSSIDIAQSIVRNKQNCIEEHSSKTIHSNIKLTECGQLNTFSTINSPPEVVYNDFDNSNELNNHTKLDTNDVQALEVLDENEVQIGDFNENSVKEKEPSHKEDSIDKNLIYRSASPDLFDEDCSIVEKNDSRIDEGEKNHTIFMDLTQSDNNFNIRNLNSIKHNSDNIIEIIECVDYNDVSKKYDIDKRKSIDGENSDVGNKIDCVQSNKVNNDENIEMIDLTQRPNLIEELPSIDLDNKNTSLELDDTVIYENHEVISEPTSNAINRTNQVTDFNIKFNGISDTNGYIQGVDISEVYDENVENSEVMNIDLTQSSGKSVGNNSNHENDENLNLSDSESINSGKGLSLDNLGNGNDINDTIAFDNDYDNDNNVLQRAASVSLNNDMEIEDVNDCVLKNSNHGSFIIDNYNDNDNNVSLQKKKTKSASLNNDMEIEDLDDVLEHSNHRFIEFDNDHNNDNDVSLQRRKSKSISLDNSDIQNVDNYTERNTQKIENGNNSDKYMSNVDIDLTQASDKSFDENDQININADIEIIDGIVTTENDDSKIDLTQFNDDIGFNDEAIHNSSKTIKAIDTSIDYDVIFDEVMSDSKKSNRNSSKEISEHNSEVFDLSDKELNYSVHHSFYQDVFDDGNINLSQHTPVKGDVYKEKTPIRINDDEIIRNKDDDDEYIIKTSPVTPMADYEAMTTPERNKELEKYGLKPFKRKRAIQLLTYVYNQTHPIIQNCSPEECPTKKFKSTEEKTPKKKSPRKKTPKKCLDFGTEIDENNIYVITSEVPEIRNIECDSNDWIFQTKEKAKVHSCRMPLHIAFYNYVSCRKLLRESILKYEPINIDIIHKQLVGYGYRYNPKDLLKFMDKKCITVKIRNWKE
ncbi:unnamed protein product [Danaus chrysippus]|uniref:Structure-specific endonuclease subunit SLX4 n=1 Tax=Danaus chrysippus TaxID=151541 RepID=A0A8J2QTW8_9NEOP|nr:unnamed protein product [Danaus chrysippus]